MIICITYGNQTHCFVIPFYEVPIKFPKVGPGPVNYPQLISDATVLGSLRAMVPQLADAKVRAAVERGLSGALEAMQAHAGSDVTIRAE